MSRTERGVENHADVPEAVVASRAATRVAEGVEDHRSRLAAIPHLVAQDAVDHPRLEAAAVATTDTVWIR